VKIGIDIGRVIIGGDGEDTFFTDDFLKTPEVSGVKQALDALWRADHEIHLVSKCGEKVEMKSLKWLAHWGFVPSYQIQMHRIHFVRKRELKAPMAQALELDIFIDDREDVLSHMEGIVAHRILFTSWEQTNQELEKIFNETG
jgi:hypothetical protein